MHGYRTLKTVISICIFSTLFFMYLPLVDEGNLFNNLYLFLLMVISFLVMSHPGLVNRLISARSSFLFHFCCVPVFLNIRLQTWGKWFHDLIVCKCVLHFLKKKSCLKLLQFSIEGCCIHDTATKKKRGDYLHYNNNLYCALDTKSVKTLKGNNCEKKREHSHSEIAKANRAEWLGHAEK